MERTLSIATCGCLLLSVAPGCPSGLHADDDSTPIDDDDSTPIDDDDSTPDPNTVGWYATAAVAPDDTIEIVHQRRESALEWIRGTPGAWFEQPPLHEVDPWGPESTGYNPALALGSDGSLHVAYLYELDQDEGGTIVRHTSVAPDGTRTDEDLASFECWATFGLDLALTPDDRPVTAVHRGNSHGCQLDVYGPDGTETMSYCPPLAHLYEQLVALTYDTTGAMHTVTFGEIDEDGDGEHGEGWDGMVYSTDRGGSMEWLAFDAQGRGAGVDLAVDVDGRALIVWGTRYDNSLQATFVTDGQADTTSLPVEDVDTCWVAAAFDSAGTAMIVYTFSDGIDEARLVTWSGDAWDSETIPLGCYPGDGLDMVVDGQGHRFVVYPCEHYQGLRVAHDLDGAWTYEVVDDGY